MPPCQFRARGYFSPNPYFGQASSEDAFFFISLKDLKEHTTHQYRTPALWREFAFDIRAHHTSVLWRLFSVGLPPPISSIDNQQSVIGNPRVLSREGGLATPISSISNQHRQSAIPLSHRTNPQQSQRQFEHCFLIKQCWLAVLHLHLLRSFLPTERV